MLVQSDLNENNLCDNRCELFFLQRPIENGSNPEGITVVTFATEKNVVSTLLM